MCVCKCKHSEWQETTTTTTTTTNRDNKNTYPNRKLDEESPRAAQEPRLGRAVWRAADELWLTGTIKNFFLFKISCALHMPTTTTTTSSRGFRTYLILFHSLYAFVWLLSNIVSKTHTLLAHSHTQTHDACMHRRTYTYRRRWRRSRKNGHEKPKQKQKPKRNEKM